MLPLPPSRFGVSLPDRCVHAGVRFAVYARSFGRPQQYIFRIYVSKIGLGKCFSFAVDFGGFAPSIRDAFNNRDSGGVMSIRPQSSAP